MFSPSHNARLSTPSAPSLAPSITPGGVPYAAWHPAVNILFCDICGFTALSQELEAEQVGGWWDGH